MSEKKVTYDPLIELIAYYQDKKTIASKKNLELAQLRKF